MFDTMSANLPLHDISLRFCVKCLKKFCSKTEQVDADAVSFFVPTLDTLFRHHFAYIKLPQKMVEIIHDIEDNSSIDLSDIAEVLHVELGDLPTYEREEEIKSFYAYSTSNNYHFCLSKISQCLR